jgi:Zn-dependent M28 family amino/carboxypeptidase
MSAGTGSPRGPGRPSRNHVALPALLVTVLTAGVACAWQAPAPWSRVDGERAHARVVRQVEFGPRIPGSPGHENMRAWLIAELRRLRAASVETQTLTDSTLGRRLVIHNVIARYGARPRRATDPPPRRLMLCAHYDTRPWSDQDPDSSRRDDPVPGANDGASGVAVLLEVAELLAREPAPAEVDLVFFDAEDQGRIDQPHEYALGARAHAAALGERRPLAAILFDTVGDRDLNIHPEVHSAERAANLVALVLEGARVTGARHFHPGPKYRMTDDHVPLLEAGIPAVDVIDFDYEPWHTHRDLPDQVASESLAEVARVAAWLVYRSHLALGG